MNNKNSSKFNGEFEKDISKLLNLKFAKLDELDFIEDETKEDFFLDADEITSPAEKREFQDTLKKIPRGKRGLKNLLSSRQANTVEKKLKKDIDGGHPKEPPLHDSLEQISVKDRTETYKKSVGDIYSQAIQNIEFTFRELVSGNRISYNRIKNISGLFSENFKTDRAIIQNLSIFYSVDPDHLPNHFLRNFLLTINIASAAGFSEPQVMELGEAAMLADIGMIMIQDSTRFTRTMISRTGEWEIKKHPILGLYALERLQGIPDSVIFAAYQHHERINGTGYPNGRTGWLIHPYSQIVSVADTFNAMCNERAYRKAYNPAEAMKKVLNMAITGLLRKQYVRNLVKYFSAFPVGSLVQLSNRSKAKVIQTNEENPMKPIVSVLTDSKENYLPENKIFQVDFNEENKLGIIKPLNSRDDLKQPMRGF